MSDLISKSELKRELKHRCVLSPLDAPYPLAYGNTDLFEILDLMPTIEAEPVKHGRWLYKELCFKGDKTPTDYTYECSVCGYKWGEDIYRYCPNCGAKMDEVE